VREGRHLEHRLFGDVLNRARKIHFALRQTALGLARRTAEQTLERLSSHGQAVRVLEVLLIHPQAAVVSQLDEMFFDQRDVLRLRSAREPHHFVLRN
jgi:hypothetical protein